MTGVRERELEARIVGIRGKGMNNFEVKKARREWVRGMLRLSYPELPSSAIEGMIDKAEELMVKR